jgi:hypothetical protein
MQQLRTTHEKRFLRSPGYWRQIRTEILNKSRFYLSLDPPKSPLTRGTLTLLPPLNKETLTLLLPLNKENLDTLAPP